MAAIKAPKNYRLYPLFGERTYDSQIRVPNLLASSALVTISGGVRPTYTADDPLIVEKFAGFPREELFIKYQGEALWLNDIETLGYLMRKCQRAPFDENMLYVAEILTELRRSDGTFAYEGLKQELNRLGSCLFKLDINHSKMVRAIAEACIDDQVIQSQAADNYVKTDVKIFDKVEWVESANSVKCHIKFRFSPTFRALVAGHYTSFINLEKFSRLKSLTAKRLVLLLSCHSKPWPYLRAELMGFTRADVINTSRFKKLLDGAFVDLFANDYLHNVPVYEKCEARKHERAYILKLRKERNKSND